MDGDRRWAKDHALPASKGHYAGYKKIEEVLRWCRETGIGTLTLFAFSTENWKRTKGETDFLMNLFYLAFNNDIKRFQKNEVRVHLIGHREGLPKKLQRVIHKVEELTKDNTKSTLNVAINYGGRLELLDTFKRILKNLPSNITEATISENLYTAGQPDPDLIIRTSGERRLSGFLTWQSVYSELFFIKHCWPEFSKRDFDNALADFANRKRRVGG